MAEIRIAVVGDSAMWGQGLVEADRYWFLATSMIRQRLGSTWVFADNIIKPHSGAKILSAIGKTRALVLPSGRIITTKEVDRTDFIDTYPEVFASEQEMVNFLDPDAAGSEEPAGRLFGDIPRTFPTITYQVESISQQQGERVDILYLNGGANDLDFETYLDPGDHKDDFRKHYDSVFKKIFYDKVNDLVRAARRKCPNAVIVIPGYFSPFNPGEGSDFAGMKKLLLSISDTSSIDLALNWVFQVKDIDSQIRMVKRRAQYASALGLYWMRRAIAELNEDPKIRGAGLIFVPSGIKPENAVFRGKSFFHEQYEADNVEDRIKEERVRSYPRVGQITKLIKLRKSLLLYNNDRHDNTSEPNLLKKDRKEVISESQELLALLKGPRQLIDLLKKTAGASTEEGVLLEEQEFFQDLRETLEVLTNELNRFNHVRIASFLHPNEAGALHYANNIVARFDRHRNTNVREDFVKLATSLNNGQKPPIVSVKDCLKRYGLDPSVGLRANMQHMIVDSLAVRITTRPPEDKQVSVGLFLDPNQQNTFDLTYLSEVDRVLVFRPGDGDLIPLDTFGDMHLSMIKQLKLVLFGSPGNPAWSPSKLELFINGKEVFRTTITKTFFTQDNELIMPYPR